MVGVACRENLGLDRLLGRLGFTHKLVQSFQLFRFWIRLLAPKAFVEKECLIGLPIPMMTATDV